MSLFLYAPLEVWLVVAAVTGIGVWGSMGNLPSWAWIPCFVFAGWIVLRRLLPRIIP